MGMTYLAYGEFVHKNKVKQLTKLIFKVWFLLHHFLSLLYYTVNCLCFHICGSNDFKKICLKSHNDRI